MARAGQTIENPVTGERFTWQQVAADTHGRSVLGEMQQPFARQAYVDAPALVGHRVQ